MGDVVGNFEKTRDVGFYLFKKISNDKGAMGSNGETPKDINQHKKNLRDVMNFFGGCQGTMVLLRKCKKDIE
jgi:FMN-dependent NADH-azoreductase